MAPELSAYDPVTRSFGRPCPATDVYAFGVLAAEVLTRAPPYGDDPQVARFPSRLQQMVACGGRPKLETAPGLLSDTPPAVLALVARCWHADPAARPPMGDVVAALGSALDTVCGDRLRPARVQLGGAVAHRVAGLAARAMRELSALAPTAKT